MLVGYSVPRIGTPASGDDRRVREIIEFATVDLGFELLPWQVEVCDRSLRMTGDNFTHRSVVVVTARQSGKTVLGAVRALAEIFLWGGKLVITAAQSRDIALESWRNTLGLAEERGLPIEKVRNAAGSEEVVFDGGGRLKVVTAGSGGRGLSPSLVVLDELSSMKTTEPYSSLEKTRRAHRGSQFFAITTEGDHTSVVLNGLQEQGRAAAEAGVVRSLCYLEWSAAPDRARDDVEGWRESNPGLGHLIDAETIRAELDTDPPEVFESEVLCRRVISRSSWLPASTWESCADHAATVPDDAQVVFALDLAPDLQHGAIAVAWPRPDGRCHVEAVSTFEGMGASVDAQRRLSDLAGRWKPRALVVVAKGPAEAVGTRVATGAGVDLVAVNGADLDRASRAFFEGVVSRRLVHPVDAVLAGAVAGIEGDGGLVRLGRSAGDVTPAIAGILAAWAVERAPVVVVPTWTAF